METAAPRLSTGQSPVAFGVGVAVGVVCVGRTLLSVAFDVGVDLAFDVELKETTTATSTTVKERRLSAA